MTAHDRLVGVVGTGTMGQGIAQVALVAGHPVRLYDAVPGRARSAAESIAARLDRLVEKGRLDAAERTVAVARLEPAQTLGELAPATLVVEAVLERLDVKQDLFRELEDVVAEDCLLATNTSSLSVTAIGGALRRPGRFVGLHFFNPAPLMPLVEVVSGAATDVTAATRAYETARAWGKTPVACADTPGFLVNRIARPFYAEAFAVYEEQGADPATIDAVLRESGGFRMGPFELTDLIGQDVNEAVTRSVWDGFFQDAKFRPSLAQRRLVEAGRLGRKSGQGWYAYGEDPERPEPHTAAGRAARARDRRGRPGVRGRADSDDARGGHRGRPGGRGQGHAHHAAQRRPARAGGRPDVRRVPRRRLLRPRLRLPQGHPHRPGHQPGRQPAHHRRGRRPLPGARQGGQRHRRRARHDRGSHRGADHRPGARRPRARGGHRGRHRHRDAPGRQLPAGAPGVGSQARPGLGLRAARGTARTRPSGRHAPSLALFRHSYTPKKWEGSA